MTELYSARTVECEVEEYDLSNEKDEIDLVLMLDIIEHIRDPEAFLLRLRSSYARHNPPRVIITTGNVAFFIVRFMLLAGMFNYGKKGILDRDHKRLFTFTSLRDMLNATGYDILDVRAIPAPYPLALGHTAPARVMLLVNQFLNLFLRGLFAYQMAYVVRPRPTVAHLLADAHDASAEKLLHKPKEAVAPSVEEAVVD